MCLASKKITREIEPERIAGVTVTTFGVDGTLFDKSGKMLYPVISWQCERTTPIMANIGKYFPAERSVRRMRSSSFYLQYDKQTDLVCRKQT